ncbi:MAG TPA: Crp/Fnr family transcriptional regulator [Candidatus Saccharimonadales bacterium]|nr:Crp/Fnr family transcriptional regulator [Candidatus Saccharimonadales bacterium]
MNSDKTKVFEAFYKQFKTRRYKKGEILIRADDDPQGIFCLTKGYVRQYSISKTGFELTLHILKPISYFPMVWAINGTPNVYYFEALTPVDVGRAPRDQVVNFIKDKPAIIFALMSELVEDYAESLTRIEHLVFSDAYRRVISVLLYIAKHFGEKDGRSIVVHHRFTQQDIATLVGVARQTASNELVHLEKKGLVKYVDHSMLFENVEKLNAELLSSPAAKMQ